MGVRDSKLLESSEEIQRRTNPDHQPALFDVGEAWENIWWDMPEFVMEDATPAYKIVVNLMTYEDLQEFAELMGQKFTTSTKSAWYPTDKMDPAPGRWRYVDDDTAE